MSMVLVDSNLLRKVATYVANTQALIEKQATNEQAIRNSASKAVDALVSQGLVTAHLKSAKVEQFVTEPSRMCEAIEKTAALITVKPIGGGETIDDQSDNSADAVFVRGIMGR